MSEGARTRFPVWLILSLCLNFFLIGLIVAGLWMGRMRQLQGALMGPGGGQGQQLPPNVVMELLPESGQVKMCQTIAGRSADMRRQGLAVVDARRKIGTIIQSAPADAAAFKAALNSLTEAQIGVVRIRNEMITELVGKLSPDELTQLASGMQRHYASARAPRGAGRELRQLRQRCRQIGAPIGLGLGE